MAIIGWLACVAMLLYFSVFSLLMVFNHGGQYTIGGAVNSFFTKLKTFLLLGFVVFLWYLVVINAPFAIIQIQK